jgi:hypothetical protein
LNKVNADVNGGRTTKKFSKRFGELMFYSINDRNRKRTLIVKDFIDKIMITVVNAWFSKAYKLKIQEIV